MGDRLIIGLNGLPGAGKDTIADHLVRHHGFAKLAFADKLKEELSEWFNVPIAIFGSAILKNSETLLCNLASCTNTDFISYWESTAEGKAEIGANADWADEKQHLHIPRTPRWLMQRWGDWRRSQQYNYFIVALQDKIDMTACRNIVITDVRFYNEATTTLHHQPAEIWWVRNVKADMNQDLHHSNHALSHSLIDRMIHNYESLDHLYYQVNEAIAAVKLKFANVLT